MNSLWPLYLWTDSALPTGGFALSHGLETLVQESRIQGTDDLFEVLLLFAQQLGSVELLTFFHVVRAKDSFQGLSRATRRLDLFPMSDEARQASLWQGRRILQIVSQFLNTEMPRGLRAYSGPATGVAARTLSMEPMATALGFLFSQVMEMASAAVRLIRLDPVEVYRGVWAMQDQVHDIIHASANGRISAMTQSAPWLEVAQARHQHQTMRLFRT